MEEASKLQTRREFQAYGEANLQIDSGEMKRQKKEFEASQWKEVPSE